MLDDGANNNNNSNSSNNNNNTSHNNYSSAQCSTLKPRSSRFKIQKRLSNGCLSPDCDHHDHHHNIFSVLPIELVCLILKFCDLRTNLALSQCNRNLSVVTSRNHVWMYLLFSNTTITRNVYQVLEMYDRRDKKARANVTLIDPALTQQVVTAQPIAALQPACKPAASDRDVTGHEFLKFLNMRLVCELNDVDFHVYPRERTDGDSSDDNGVGSGGGGGGSELLVLIPHATSALNAIMSSRNHNRRHHHLLTPDSDAVLQFDDVDDVEITMEYDDMYANASLLERRTKEAVDDELKNINYKRQYVELMRDFKESEKKAILRRLEKSRRQNRLFTVGSISFLLLLLSISLYLLTQGLYLDSIIPRKGMWWLLPFMILVILFIPGLLYFVVGFAVALKWNPFVQQNYFTTLSKHTKNYFVLSLGHFCWMILAIVLVGSKMVAHQNAPNWNYYMIPIYCWWTVTPVINGLLAFAVYREQSTEISHLLEEQKRRGNSRRKERKIGRALDCARAKISCSRLLCFSLYFTYLCLLLSVVLSVSKYDASLAAGNPNNSSGSGNSNNHGIGGFDSGSTKKQLFKAGYSVLLIPFYLLFLFWIVIMPILLRYIVYIMMGSPTPAPTMDFFFLVRFFLVMISSFCAEVLLIPFFISSILLGLRLDNLIRIRYVWVFSPVFFVHLVIFSAFALMFAYALYAVLKNRV